MSVILSSTTDKVQVVTSSTADIAYETFYAIADASSSPMVPKGAENKVGAITTATTTDISGSPGSNEKWSLWFDLRNTHASASNDVTVQLVKSGGTARDLIKATLYAGWKLVRRKDGAWLVYDAAGGIVGGAVSASDSLPGVVQYAVQSDMESASSNVLAVTPGRLQYHPGVAKAWCKATGDGTTLTVSYGVSSITDNGTGRLQVNLATAFSSANYAILATPELTATTYAVANDRKCHVRSANPTTAAFEVDCIDSTATTNVVKDPQNYYIACFGDQ